MSIDRGVDKEAVVYIYNGIFSSVQLLSHVRLFATPWIATRQVSLSITNSWSSPKLLCIESVMPSSHLILLSPSPPAPNPSQHQSFPKSQLFAWGGQSIGISALASVQFSSVQSLSRVQLFATPWIAAHPASLSVTNSWSSPKLMCIKSVMPSSHFILLSPSPPAPNPSQQQNLFQWVNSSHKVAKVLEF